VPLTLVGVDDQPVGAGQVEVDPGVVSVQIEVRAVETETTVAVRPNMPGAPAPGFALEAIRVEPAYVTIVGLPEVLAQITSITTEPISIDGLSTDQSSEVDLRLPDDISLADGEPASVTVTAVVGPSVSSRTFVVGVVCSGATGGNACLPRLGELAITLSGAGNALSSLTAADLTPTVDVSGLEPGNYDLQPVLTGLPDGVELVAINPGTVPVTVEAPEPTPTPAP
jgi:YbbR domain-containing protein